MKSNRFKILLTITSGLFLLFITAEILLSGLSTKKNYTLVKVENIFNTSKYVFQPDIINHYLDIESVNYANMPAEVFDVKKKKNTIRIICLGGTAASGFPFVKNATFPFQLQFRLRNALLDDYVEVINMALPGISSSILKDLMPQVFALQPDQLIFYLGDDEFLTQQKLAANSVKRFKTVDFIKSLFENETNDSKDNLIPKYLVDAYAGNIGDQEVAVFKENYLEIIRLAQQNQTQVLLSSIPIKYDKNLTTINKTIAEIAKETNVPYVDTESVFKQAAQNKKRILFDAFGNFTFRSQMLAAQTLFQALYLLQFKNPLNKLNFKENLLSKADIETIIEQYPKRKAGITDLDMQIGKSKAVYVQQEQLDQSGNNKTETIVKQYLENKLSWQGAHYKLAEQYIAENNLEQAFKEYRAVNLSYYEDYIPHMKIADLFFLQQEYHKSRLWLGRAKERSIENPLLDFKMGQTLLFLNDFAKAVSFLEKSAKHIDQLKKENIDAAYFYYLLALCQANLKNWLEADKAISSSLFYNKAYKPTLLLEQKIKKYKNP